MFLLGTIVPRVLSAPLVVILGILSARLFALQMPRVEMVARSREK